MLFWLVMTGSLLRDELGVERLPASRAETFERTESWWGLFTSEGQRVGSIHLLGLPEEVEGEPGYRMALEARMQLVLMGKPSELELDGSIWRSMAGARVIFDFNVGSAGFDFAVEGGVSEGWLKGEVTSAGETLPLGFPVEDELIFAGGLGSALQLPVLDVGEEFRLDSFDPLTLSRGEARVRYIARETLEVAGGTVEARRLRVAMNGLESDAWTDDRGEVLRADTPIGLILERITAEEAGSTPPELDDLPGLLETTSIRPTGQRPFRGARRMTVRLRGVDDLSLPTDRVQVGVEPGVYRMTVPDLPGATASTMQGPALAEHLRSDAFVQSDHPEIRDRARVIVGDAQEPWEKSLKIHDWVFSQLDKEAVLSIPSALEVLKRRRGDCNEHTVLFTALSRSVGIPTRIAIGIVWSDELEGFYYHAWPEVGLEDWVWMDPTLDQTLADATHLKLASGGIETWPRLLAYLGRLEIEVLEIE